MDSDGAASAAPGCLSGFAWSVINCSSTPKSPVLHFAGTGGG